MVDWEWHGRRCLFGRQGGGPRDERGGLFGRHGRGECDERDDSCGPRERGPRDEPGGLFGWHGRGPRDERGGLFGPHGPEHRDERGGRARRGELRHLILDALRDQERHGYEIIRVLEERSAGQYVPSPGSVYPTLQYLEDLGLVVARQDAERKVYGLTDAGRADLQANDAKVEAFWARFRGPRLSGAAATELRCLREDAALLFQILRDGAIGAVASGDLAALQRLRQAVADSREAVRRVLAEALTVEPGDDGEEAWRAPAPRAGERPKGE
jgi:DNA-binding PadR family transcriptional regulator